MTTRTGLPELWGAAEIAKHLCVSRQRTQQLIGDRFRVDTGFPEPAAILDMGKVWLAVEVREWARGYARRGTSG